VNSNEIKKRRRARLMKEDPHCCYCGCEVVYYVLKEGEQAPDNFATIEHVNTRIDGLRPKQGTRLLACYKCNHEKGNADHQALGIEELRRRSQGGTY